LAVATALSGLALARIPGATGSAQLQLASCRVTVANADLARWAAERTTGKRVVLAAAALALALRAATALALLAVLLLALPVRVRALGVGIFANALKNSNSKAACGQ
jgi:hypothetical protein